MPWHKQGAPYPEVTDLNLPSSFSIIHSNALVYSTYLPVTVYGTVIVKKRYFLKHCKVLPYTLLQNLHANQ
jgi:hypothetical protein